MELIKNERSRNSTYQKRKKSLEKKSNELSILCQVKLCMIVYGPKDSEPTIWPDKDTVLSLIYSYRARSDDDKRLRTHDLSFYFRDLTRKVEIESSKLRKRNFEAKYPTWDQHYDSLSSDQLKQLSALLGAKIEFMKQRLELLKGTQTISLEDMHAMSFLGKQVTQPNTQCVMQSLVRISSLQLEIIEQQQQQLVPPLNFPETEIMPFGQHQIIQRDNHQSSGISTGIPHCTGTGYEPHLAILNASGNVIESQRCVTGIWPEIIICCLAIMLINNLNHCVILFQWRHLITTFISIILCCQMLQLLIKCILLRRKSIMKWEIFNYQI
uniref:Agamous-like MADS-box protein AGL92 n=1 Tax=Nicotiana tabacum TaxID=4097 RepID=A0A1S3X128_TOBAC|nr:PREDICTED: agamous-like MADS-box protein AGL92 [Nicotiana tabacum]